MIGRVGTAFGGHGINISSAAVGHVPEHGDESLAVMVVTGDQPVPDAVVDELVASEDFLAGRAVNLS